MRQTLFLGTSISILLFLFSFNASAKHNLSNQKTKDKTTITYFKDFNRQTVYYPPYEKSLYSQSSNSLQRDTSKKKIVVPDNGQVQPQEKRIVTSEIDALLLDATYSPGGYDFYVDFSQNWTPPAGALDYNIVVKEYRGRGVMIVVAIEVNGVQLVYRRMRPIYPALHGLAVAAANYLNGYIARGDHLRGVDADGNFIDVQRTDATRQIKTPFDIY